MISGRSFLATLILALVALHGEASARPRGGRYIYSTPRERMRNQAAAQVTGNAERVRAGDASNRLSSARGNLEGTNYELKVATEERTELENQILQEAGPDHPANRSKAAFEQATDELKRWHAKALNSESWQAEKRAAEKAGRSREQIDALEADMLRRHSDYFAAKARHELTATEYRRLRHELFSADARWNENISDGRRLQADQSEAARNAAAQARRQINADARAKDADRTAAAADSTVQQGQAKLNQLQQKFRAYGRKQRLPGVTPSAGSSKGNKASK